MTTSTAAIASSSIRKPSEQKHNSVFQDTIPKAACQELLMPSWSGGSSSSTDSASMRPMTPKAVEKSHSIFRPEPNAQKATESSSRRSACIATTLSPTAAAAAAAAPAAATVGLPQGQVCSLQSIAMHKIAKALAEAGIQDSALLAFANADGTYPPAAAAVASDADTAHNSSSGSSSVVSTQEFADSKKSIQQLATALAQAGMQDSGLDMLAHGTHKITTASHPAAAAAAAGALTPAAKRDCQVKKQTSSNTSKSSSSSSSNSNSSIAVSPTWIQKLVAIERRISRSSSSSGSSKCSGMISEALKTSAAATVPAGRLFCHRQPSARLNSTAGVAGNSSSSSSNCGDSLSRNVNMGSTPGPQGQSLLANSSKSTSSSSSSSSSSCQVAQGGTVSWVQALSAKDKLPGSSSSTSSDRAGILTPLSTSLRTPTAVNLSSMTRTEINIHLKNKSTSNSAELGSSSSGHQRAAKIAGSPVAGKKVPRRGKSTSSKRRWLHRLAACISSSTLSGGGT